MYSIYHYGCISRLISIYIKFTSVKQFPLLKALYKNNKIKLNCLLNRCLGAITSLDKHKHNTGVYTELVFRLLALLQATNPVPALVSCLHLTLRPTSSTGVRPATASNPSAECQRPDWQAIRQRLRKLEAIFPDWPHKVHQEKILAAKLLKLR